MGVIKITFVYMLMQMSILISLYMKTCSDWLSHNYEHCQSTFLVKNTSMQSSYNDSAVAICSEIPSVVFTRTKKMRQTSDAKKTCAK